MPPEETGQVPVSYARAEPRWFGVTPPSLLLGLALVVLAVAVVLFATGGWPVGLILLGVGILLVAVFLETARRKPDGPVTQRSAEAFDGVRARAGSALESFAARSRAGRQSARLRGELVQLHGRRRDLFAAFGDAVYRGDEAAAEELRARIAELDERAASLELELQRLLASAHERIEKARLAVQETEMVEVPEPYPPPDEGTPPAPAIVPEPSPPPDEGTPPQPDPVPEPTPSTDPTPPSPDR